MAGTGRAPQGPAPASRLHQLHSFDPAGFPVPTGREEDWRFTPLRRMRGLAGDTTLAESKVTAETDPAPEVAASRAERGHRRGSCELHCGSLWRRRPASAFLGRCPRPLGGGDSRAGPDTPGDGHRGGAQATRQVAPQAEHVPGHHRGSRSWP
jgi:hypothetical protein